jgi:alpha-L-fucosidase 2
MLLQSHDDELHILPALPSKIPDGYVKGLCARGGFEVDMCWNGGLLKQLTVRSKAGKQCRIKINRKVLGDGLDKEIIIDTDKKGEYTWDYQ